MLPAVFPPGGRRADNQRVIFRDQQDAPHCTPYSKLHRLSGKEIPTFDKDKKEPCPVKQTNMFFHAMKDTRRCNVHTTLFWYVTDQTPR